MHFFTSCLSIVLLGGSLAAQIPPISPAVTKFSAASTTAFTAPSFPQLGPTALGFTPGTATTTLNQLELRKVSTGSTFFRLAVASAGVPVNFGGVGGQDVVEGVFDAATGSVQMSNLAAAFNTAGNEATLSISENGLIAVSSGAATKWSSRAAIGTAWPAPQVVTGLTGLSVFDAKLFTDGTQLKLAWRDIMAQGQHAGNVWVGDFNSGAVSNMRVLMAASLGRIGLNSPHPVNEEIPAGSGNWVVHGWLVGRRWNAQDSDSFWLPGADASVNATAPPRPLAIWDEPRIQHNGTTLGNSGTQYWVYDQRLDPIELSTVSLTGWNFSAAAGGPVHLRALVPWSATQTWLTAIFLGLPISPVPVPGTIGNPLGQNGPAIPLGLLGVSPVVTLQAPVSPTNPGGVTFSFTVAPGSVPANLPIPMQVVAVNVTAGRIYLGNTAAIEGL